MRYHDPKALASDFPEAVISRSRFLTGTAEGRSHGNRGIGNIEAA
ncbi:MAG: hypothetical protein ACK5NY_05120 [Burkholderiaceae bacterium]|jgi:hypothetical protein